MVALYVATKVYRRCVYKGNTMDCLYSMGNADLYGGVLFVGDTKCVSTDLFGTGQCKSVVVSCFPEKNDFTDSADLHITGFLWGYGQGVCCIFGRTGGRYHSGIDNAGDVFIYI